MDVINSFACDVLDLFEKDLIYLNKETRMVEVNERAMYMLCDAYKMYDEDIFYFLQKTIRFAELPENG